MILIASRFPNSARRRDAATWRRGDPHSGVRSPLPAFPRRRVSASALLAWFAGHLQHGASGNLLHNANGHLANACASASVTCPTVCSACPATYPLTVAGVGGPGDSCCIAALNGTFTLTRIANNCQWATGVFPQTGGCTFGWEMFCSMTDCNEVAGPMRWVIAMYGSIGLLWAEKISSASCPPAGAYAICSNLCSGGVGTSVVLG